MSENETTETLRNLLMGSIRDVRDGKIEPRTASAMSSIAQRVIQSAKLDLDWIKFKKKYPGIAPESLRLAGPKQKKVSAK